MTILIIGIAVVGIALGAAGAVWAQDYWRQRKAQRELKPILDWRPTLRMDARATAEAELSEDDNVPAPLDAADRGDQGAYEQALRLGRQCRRPP